MCTCDRVTPRSKRAKSARAYQHVVRCHAGGARLVFQDVAAAAAAAAADWCVDKRRAALYGTVSRCASVYSVGSPDLTRLRLLLL